MFDTSNRGAGALSLKIKSKAVMQMCLVVLIVSFAPSAGSTSDSTSPVYFFQTSEQCIMMMDFQNAWNDLSDMSAEQRSTIIGMQMVGGFRVADVAQKCGDLLEVQLMGVRIPELDEYDRPSFGSRITLLTISGERDVILDDALAHVASLGEIKALLEVNELE
ncbi:MAG: hypothetical protein P1U69_13720 [Parvibaculaceae bacterium]|nr:hypothetical protein [Parvibaculaceae bacterium]|tara:strand:- start:6856 stop:7344 length:489 start_codon:yes stop_codon:yes gene_type:complete